MPTRNDGPTGKCASDFFDVHRAIPKGLIEQHSLDSMAEVAHESNKANRLSGRRYRFCANCATLYAFFSVLSRNAG